MTLKMKNTALMIVSVDIMCIINNINIIIEELKEFEEEKISLR